MKRRTIILFLCLISLWACRDDMKMSDTPFTEDADLSIFFVNDQHGRIDNFSKVQAIVDEAKASGNALLVSAGDIFSGNPIVDQYKDPGYPMIDIMNQTGFDVGVLGNHEFDFGTEVLKDRIQETQFPWILANVDPASSIGSEVTPYVTLSVGGLRVTFLGLVETNGKEGATIPSTHPLRVADLDFQRYQDVINDYADLKAQENADLLVALTHLGSGADRALARTYPYFDLIIGGHSHEMIEENISDIPLVQAGSNLRFLGRIDLKIENQEIKEYKVDMINLNAVATPESELAAQIEAYNSDPSFSEVVGESSTDLEYAEVGCFYTTALQEYMQVDFTIQNGGGIRAGIDQGPITRMEVFTMDPFNNQSVAFTKTVGEFESFFCETGARFYFTGIQVMDQDGTLQIVDTEGQPLPNEQVLTMGVNDYIPAVFDDYFDFSDADIRPYTTAEAIIGYLQNLNTSINFEDCSRSLDCD